jgi:hypothetical protein
MSREPAPGCGRIGSEAPRKALEYEDKGLIESRNLLDRKI